MRENNLNGRCPICEYLFEECQCYYGRSAHPDRHARASVVFDHKEVQIQKIGCLGSIVTIKVVLETLKTGAHKDEPKKEKTIGEIFETLTEEQKQAVYAVIGLAVEEKMNDEAKPSEKQEPPFVPKDSMAIDINELLRQLGMEGD